jgi:GNAT superfamily N-acetyltransferase
MPALQIHPLSEEHLDAAADLLAARHERHRRAEPLLPAVTDFRAQIEDELGRDGAAGVVAVSTGGKLEGYLVGRTTPDDCVIGFAGCATIDPELVRDLYAELSADWVAAGLTRHRAYIPASDAALVDAWFRLAFGVQFTYAVRETAPEAAVDAGAELRLGRPEDASAVAQLERAFSKHLRSAPSFSARDVATDEDVEAEWAGTWDDPTFTHFVATKDERVVGHLLLYRRPAGDLRIPDDNIDLALATTQPDVRGSGVGRALTAHALHWAHEQGFRTMTIDWRVVNLLADRFFTRWGFRPTFMRLYRHVP